MNAENRMPLGSIAAVVPNARPDPGAALETKKILLPIDVENCPIEILSYANAQLAKGHATVVLLHVIGLNIRAPVQRVYDELAGEARRLLVRLAGRFMHGADVAVRIRLGRPAEEIAAEARATGADLIVLAKRPASAWKRFAARMLPDLVEDTLRRAPCPVAVLRVKTHPNCKDPWTGLCEVASALDFLRGAGTGVEYNSTAVGQALFGRNAAAKG